MEEPQSAHFTSPASRWASPEPSVLDRSARPRWTAWKVARSMMASWVPSTRYHSLSGVSMTTLDL